jgi:ABC-2 type transport system ATP-binding protein
MSELENIADHLVVIGRGRVIADTAVHELIARASNGQVQVRTAARDRAITALATAGARVAATGPEVLTVAGLSSERTVAELAAQGIPFSEVTTHRASLEEAYMELTRDAVEFHATLPGADPVSPAGGAS